MSVIFEPINHIYSDEKGKEYPSVTTILSHFGMTPDFDKFGNDTSRDFGTAVHKVLELFDNDVLHAYNYDPVIEPYLNGYKKFLKEFKPEWEMIETPLISKIWGFAGTADRVGVIKGKTCVLDFKTGSPNPYHELQTAGYQVLVEDNYKVNVKVRHSLYLMPDDFRLSPEYTKRSDRSIMIGQAQSYQWKLTNKLIRS